MMSAREKSDLPEVAWKRANKKAASAAAEPRGAKGQGQGECGTAKSAGGRRRARSGRRAGQPSDRRRPAYEKPSSGIEQDRLTALAADHLTVDVLRASFFGLKKIRRARCRRDDVDRIRRAP